jgi:hypothetical protein
MIPKNSFFSKATLNALNIKGTPLGLSVKRIALGTEGLSLMNVSTFY